MHRKSPSHVQERDVAELTDGLRLCEGGEGVREPAGDGLLMVSITSFQKQ